MGKILGFNKFLESTLNLDDLEKITGGEKRGTILLRKIKNGDPILSIDSGKETKPIVINKMVDKDSGEYIDPKIAIDQVEGTDGKYDNDKGLSYFKKNSNPRSQFKNVFRDESGEDFKLNQIVKTMDFGSSGAGRNTVKFEAIQCLFMGIKQVNPNIMLGVRNLGRKYKEYKQMFRSGLVKFSDNISYDEELLNQFLGDLDWAETFSKIPNRLWRGYSEVDEGGNRVYKKYLNSEIQYYIYHTSYKGIDSPYIAILNKYKELSVKGDPSERFNDIRIEKWCPADTYLISKDNRDSIISQIQRVKDMPELNILIDTLFDDFLLIPLSLKKIKKGCDFKIITNREKGKELPYFDITSFTIGKSLKGIGSKIGTTSTWRYRNGKRVDQKDRNINLDSSDTSRKQNIDGEVEGSASRHGKVSFKSIKRILNSFGVQGVEDFTVLSEMGIDDIKKMIIDLSRKIKKSNCSKMVRVLPIERAKDISANENKLISRLQSLQIVYALCQLYSRDPDMANDAITKIMRFALSIQTDKFETPRYLRVI